MTKENFKNTLAKHRIDIIVIASLLLLSIAVLLLINLTKKDGATVVVTLDGVTVGEYSLDRDGEYSLNDGSNVLTIKDGRAYMTYSSCPDHICERTGKIKFVGETIVCLPNKLTATITGESEDAVDFVS